MNLEERPPRTCPPLEAPAAVAGPGASRPLLPMSMATNVLLERAQQDELGLGLGLGLGVV